MSKRRVTIKDIAKEINVSIGTVDRAIHGRGRINDETKELIMQKIQEMGYKPNTIARVLSKNRVSRIAFISPSYNYFFQDIISGAQKACKELDDYLIDLELVTQDSENDPLRQLKDFTGIMEKDISACVIAPLHPFLLSGVINKAADMGLPVITVNLDSKDSKRICYVGQDSFKTGAIVGSIFGKFLKGKGEIALLTGISDLFSWQLRTEGFIDTLKRDFPNIDVTGTYSYTNSIEVAYEISKMLIENNPVLSGIFANTTEGTIGIGMAIRDMNKKGSVIAVGYDTQNEIMDLLDDNSVVATVTQNPFSQGYYAIKLMNKILLEKFRPEKEFYYTRADVIINRLHFDLYGNSLDHISFI